MRIENLDFGTSRGSMIFLDANCISHSFPYLTLTSLTPSLANNVTLRLSRHRDAETQPLSTFFYAYCFIYKRITTYMHLRFYSLLALS